MRGVELPPVDRPPHTSGMGYSADLGVWEIGCAGGTFTVAGTPATPDAEWLDLAWRVAGRIDELLAEANAYLGTFAGHRGWAFEEAVFGREAGGPADRFDLVLSAEGDHYGAWWVRFLFAGQQMPRYFPNEFGRRQM